MITESPALHARERRVFARDTQSLAALIAEETGDSPDAVEPRAVATALLGVHRALIDWVRRRLVAGASALGDRHKVRGEAERAFARLERGLGDYGLRG